ncbi:MAG: nucleotidyltransferase domain-containing protein, partial [Lentisphaerota bacterium]
MKEQILTELKRIEQEQNVKVLYAVESGSRAWGFASTNSDWDVRFIYVHPLDWYLSIQERKDNYAKILPNDIDLGGWELRKSLNLFRKSNPPLLEWLRSPNVYYEDSSFINGIRELSQEYFNPKSTMYHYLHMADGNYRDYLKGAVVRMKKYFYV